MDDIAGRVLKKCLGKNTKKNILGDSKSKNFFGLNFGKKPYKTPESERTGDPYAGYTRESKNTFETFLNRRFIDIAKKYGLNPDNPVQREQIHKLMERERDDYERRGKVWDEQYYG
jgi:hypothetical protein